LSKSPTAANTRDLPALIESIRSQRKSGLIIF